MDSEVLFVPTIALIKKAESSAGSEAEELARTLFDVLGHDCSGAVALGLNPLGTCSSRPIHDCDRCMSSLINSLQSFSNPSLSSCRSFALEESRASLCSRPLFLSESLLSLCSSALFSSWRDFTVALRMSFELARSQYPRDDGCSLSSRIQLLSNRMYHCWLSSSYLYRQLLQTDWLDIQA